MLNKWLNLKNENLRLQHNLVQSREQYEDLAEELAAEVQQKGLLHFVHGSTSKSGAKGACQEVRRDVRQGVRKETDRCISNCVRPSKKQHRMRCWFCGKVGHKKVECFAREKSRNMAKKVNKTFTKPKRVEEMSLAKSGLLDEIKDETLEDGCSSGRSDLEVDQEASSLEPGHERELGADGEGLMVKKKTHDRSLVLNRSWSKDSSTGASDRDAVLVIPLQQGLCHDYT
ncbi:hypothetical protein F2Q70_00039249 [Brassica cretica]|uniref:CCHC-type domain-containing protein n=1 Tax=Brassica cretica TaxID=69181 RepID=A0A8S9K793_BRACR|nr:hypothetical protein F2Q70_00039249 [Brassica cretica]